MEGISKERLIEIQKEYSNPMEWNLVSRLISECTELNPWLPIADAPIRKPIRVFAPLKEGFGGQKEIYLHHEDHKRFYTHYQELPENPKE